MAVDRILSTLSMAAKAGKVQSGGFMVEKTILQGTACLVIIAEDAAGNTSKKFKDSCTFYNVPYYLYGNSEDLGHYIGKEFRKVLAITDQGFANSLVEKLDLIQKTEVNK